MEVKTFSSKDVMGNVREVRRTNPILHKWNIVSTGHEMIPYSRKGQRYFLMSCAMEDYGRLRKRISNTLVMFVALINFNVINYPEQIANIEPFAREHREKNRILIVPVVGRTGCRNTNKIYFNQSFRALNFENLIFYRDGKIPLYYTKDSVYDKCILGESDMRIHEYANNQHLSDLDADINREFARMNMDSINFDFM